LQDTIECSVDTFYLQGICLLSIPIATVVLATVDFACDLYAAELSPVACLQVLLLLLLLPPHVVLQALLPDGVRTVIVGGTVSQNITTPMASAEIYNFTSKNIVKQDTLPILQLFGSFILYPLGELRVANFCIRFQSFSSGCIVVFHTAAAATMGGVSTCTYLAKWAHNADCSHYLQR
jgi:hypothetical protein